MELVSMAALLSQAARGKYAVAAINCCNLENIRDTLEAAHALRSPIILQAAPREAFYAHPRAFVETARAIGAGMELRAAIHLDHGDSYETAVRCMQGGFTSVMFDGSLLPFEENIRLSRQVVTLAHSAGISAEVELGTIGQTSEQGEKIEKDYLTDPQLAGVLAEQTQADCLAVAIGNAHGLYTFAPNLDFERLSAIRAHVKVPLVLHGGTGLPEAQIKKAISMGVAKVNFSTITRVAWIGAVRDYMRENPDTQMTMDIIGAGSAAFRRTVHDCIQLVGSEGRMGN